LFLFLFVIQRKIFLKNVLKIIGIAFILAIFYNHFSPKGIPLLGFDSGLKPTADSISFSQSDISSFITDISIEQTKKLIEQNNIILIDARSEIDFLKSHLIGSVNIPFKNFDKHVEKIFQYPHDTKFVIYCEGIHCNLSHELAKVLSQFGYNKIYIMKEGIQEWEKRGLPLSRQ
jgi:rhodanese-related sulfurtransferase